MLFHTFPFLAFFVAVVAIYWALPGQRARLVWLLAASAWFYMSWNPWLIGLILFSAGIDYAAALWLEHLERPWHRRAVLLGSISTNLGLLAFFKYANFFLDTAYTLHGWLGGEPTRRLLEVVLPLGISFYTFETISYVVDVYRGRTRAVRDPVEYALFILFFPHLVAGPIVRPRDFLPQLRRRHRFCWPRAALGLQLFLVGAFKKAVLADHVALVIDPIFAQPLAYDSASAWLATLGYAAQIYLDFSGYSDMAVGLAHLLGYRLPRNFARPYLAADISEFWRRWHISLSSWLRDYLFIPLGGSRTGRWRTCRNLLVTMLLGGLWHGANWTFIVWGLYHGVLLTMHHLVRGRLAVSRPLGVAITFLAVCVGWVFFRAQTLADAGALLARLFWPTGGLALARHEVLTVLAVVMALWAGHLAGAWLARRRQWTWLPAPVLGAALAALALLTLLLLPEDGRAFIYFQF